MWPPDIIKQEFSASSWRSNQGYTKMHGQPTIKIWTECVFVNQLSCNVQISGKKKKYYFMNDVIPTVNTTFQNNVNY